MKLCLFPTSAWIKVEQLKPYHAHKEEMIKINKGKRFQQAVDAVEEFLRRAKGKDQVREREAAVVPPTSGQWFAWFREDGLCQTLLFREMPRRGHLCPELCPWLPFSKACCFGRSRSPSQHRQRA